MHNEDVGTRYAEEGWEVLVLGRAGKAAGAISSASSLLSGIVNIFKRTRSLRMASMTTPAQGDRRKDVGVEQVAICGRGRREKKPDWEQTARHQHDT